MFLESRVIWKYLTKSSQTHNLQPAIEVLGLANKYTRTDIEKGNNKKNSQIVSLGKVF